MFEASAWLNRTLVNGVWVSWQYFFDATANQPTANEYRRGWGFVESVPVTKTSSRVTIEPSQCSNPACVQRRRLCTHPVAEVHANGQEPSRDDVRDWAIDNLVTWWSGEDESLESATIRAAEWAAARGCPQIELISL